LFETFRKLLLVFLTKLHQGKLPEIIRSGVATIPELVWRLVLLWLKTDHLKHTRIPQGCVRTPVFNILIN